METAQPIYPQNSGLATKSQSLGTDELIVTWEFWKTTQSYHGKPAIVDLTEIGDLDRVDIDYTPLLTEILKEVA